MLLLLVQAHDGRLGSDVQPPDAVTSHRGRTITTCADPPARNKPGIFLINPALTCSRRTQSRTNQSPLPNSLLTGKLTWNFVESARLVRILKADTRANSEVYSNSLLNGREFESENREFEPGIVQSDFG